MGTKRNVNMSENTDVIKIVSDGGETVETNEVISTEENQNPTEEQNTSETAEKTAKKEKVVRHRSKKYQVVRAQVDKTKTYDPFAAIELIKKLSYTSFAGTITADMVVKEEGIQANVSFPHSTGRAVRVAIVNDELLAQIEAGTIDFDILVTEPRFMGKIAKFARVLGPKGLMPNPKNGTVTANPELKKKELESGQVTVKAEKKAPLMHVSLGKTSMETQQLLENLTALTTALKGKIVKLSLSASMSPSVKVAVE